MEVSILLIWENAWSNFPAIFKKDMRWSKLKHSVESRFADSVRGRVEIFSTCYNKPKSWTGRGWITIDGIEIANFSTMKSGQIYRCVYHETTPTDYMTHPAVREDERTPGALIEEGEFSRFDLHNCCFEYLNLSIEEAFDHSSPLINLLAVLDGRFGKRRLQKLDIEKLHPLVRKLYEFRIKCEGIHVNSTGGA